jgi:hypothetical protein
MNTTPELRERLMQERSWTISTELLAQLVEEVSILAADHRRKKPREVPRPDHLKRRKIRAEDVDGSASVAPAVATLMGARHPVGQR